MSAAETSVKPKFFKWSVAVGLVGVGFVSGWIAQTKLRFLGEAVVEASVIAKHGDASSNTRKQVLDIVKMKSKDMNAVNEESAFRVIAGTARSMGIEVVG